MAKNYGSGVSRVLDTNGKSYQNIIWQKGRPPMDAEFTALADLAQDWSRRIVSVNTPSGWFGSETSSLADYTTNPLWSNQFRFGSQRTGESQAVSWASVNGWLVPVMGTKTGSPPGSANDTDTFNVITLDPPPANSGDYRTDFAYLEVWLARVAPNPSTTNKPSASTVYRYGNVEGGYTFLADDLIDPTLGFETTQRVQLQYRIRVVKGVTGLASNPDGFDPISVKAQGAATAPTTFTFTNMRQTLGDPGLWRAGDGTANSLATVDGYVYAIPLCAVFRRNAVAWLGEPSPNLNGGFNRNPTATDRTGAATFAIMSLGANLAANATSLTLVSATNSPLPLLPASPVLIQIGEELMTYASISGTTVNTLVRGVNGTRAEFHKLGTPIQVISGRPDGFYSDQIASTDILDLRHLVNANGFDYTALLKGNLDKLVRGKLRANWKRAGNGSQGPFVTYQDKLSPNAAALGVSKLDAPDNFRQVFSDAPAIQKLTYILKPNSGSVPSPINANWSLTATATHTLRVSSNQFSATDTIVLPVADLKSGLSGGDADQVRWLNDGVLNAVTLRIDGQNGYIPTSQYTVTPANPTSADNLTITFGGSFPGTTRQIYATVHVLYGGGRGLSRRPDSIHSVTYLQPSTELLLNPRGVPANNLEAKTARATLWSKYRANSYKGNLPVTAEAYADLGSKTLILNPFRRIIWPTEFRTMDGTAVNVTVATPTITSTTGSTAGTTTFTDSSVNFTTASVTAGMALEITNGPQPGLYTVMTVGTTTLTTERAIPTGSSLSYTITPAQGLMPRYAKNGSTLKWTTTDPLGLFSGSTDTTSTGFANTKNIYVTLPRNQVPGKGAVYCPILPSDNTVFAEGINFMCISKKDATPTANERNFVPYANGAISYAAFSTLAFGSPDVAATYNAVSTYGGINYAGIRAFTDTTGLGRTGLELPPFYGIARLFAVYEAADYKANGSAYIAADRTARGSGATNLLKQSVTGPTFWIESDADGDATFVLNSECIDITRSPNVIANFAAGNYVVEASVFGFDRGSFELDKEFRLVLTRPTSPSLMRSECADTAVRANNIGAVLTSPISVLPGPATTSDSVLINYSRTVYQGDPWGSQTSNTDIGYLAGSLQSATAFQVSGSGLTQASLTRPNQKVLEVLASCTFGTTLGTGRLSGDTVGTSVADFRNIGYEDSATFPPASGGSARPVIKIGGLATAQDIASDYLGAIERLPLGSLFRDKDFHGDSLKLVNGNPAPFVFFEDGLGLAWSNLAPSNLERTEVALDTGTVSSGMPGDVLVQVDGEQGNYSLLVNYRTNRGGSLFVASGDHSGGELGVSLPTVQTATGGSTNILFGKAFLVRNAVTSVGASEVSAGDELMLLVVTTAKQLKTTDATTGSVYIGTNGASEGYSAADLYRIEGHPLLNDHIRFELDPTTITLVKRSS